MITVEVFFQDTSYGTVTFGDGDPRIDGGHDTTLQAMIDSCVNRLAGQELNAENFIASLHGHWWGQIKE